MYCSAAGSLAGEDTMTVYSMAPPFSSMLTTFATELAFWLIAT